MDSDALLSFVSKIWDDEVVPRLVEYIKIPCKSPHFDALWQSSGHLEKAVQFAAAWCRAQPLPGMQLEVLHLPGRTPLLFFEIPGSDAGTVLLYGHLDKQPEMEGWRQGLGPWTPVLEQGRLYGRGGGDDGYAVFAAITALLALQKQGVAHSRCVGIIECCEESGSYDLPAYLDALRGRIGDVDLVIGLDSGCGDYERLWVTTSLRGLVGGTLNVQVLREGVHSGDASGVVPSSFRIARLLLDRLEEAASGRVKPGEFHCPIPAERTEQAIQAGRILGDGIWKKFPFAGTTQPMASDLAEAVLNRTWRPALSVVGAGGLPAIKEAGNVLRPRTALKLSLRIPPAVDGEQAAAQLKRLLEADPPAGAAVSFDLDHAASGWSAPPTAPWLQRVLDSASGAQFGPPAAMMGEGGTIPFMAMLGRQFPQAQCLITGVLGPQSNAHGPNEFIDIAYAKRITACVAQVIAAHARRD